MAKRVKLGRGSTDDQGDRRMRLLALWTQAEGETVAAEAIYLTLREAILSGILSPGERLGEVDLAQLFRRSRTPVREAILRLESERLTERSRRGFVVGSISREEVLEVYAVRTVLDGLAARLAAHSILPSELEHLRWLNRQISTAASLHDYQRVLNLNIEFHEVICVASRNSLLLQFLRQIHSWVRRFSDTTLSQPGRAAAASTEHEALLDAIGRRDSVEAERLARQHMEHAMQVRVGMLQDSVHRPALGARPRATMTR
jgi:DNA-binding GntR family transcriptional regulator